MTISSSDPLLSHTSSWDSPLSPALPTSLFGALLRHRSGVSAWDRGAGDCVNLSLERREVALELLVFLIQPLNSGECDAIGVDGADGGVVLSYAKGSREILRRRTDVLDIGILRFVVPSLDRHGGHSLQDAPAVYRSKVVLHAAVGEVGPGTTASRQGDARCRCRIGVEADATTGTSDELVGRGRADIGSGVVAPDEAAALCGLCLAPGSEAEDATGCVGVAAWNRGIGATGCVDVAAWNRGIGATGCVGDAAWNRGIGATGGVDASACHTGIGATGGVAQSAGNSCVGAVGQASGPVARLVVATAAHCAVAVCHAVRGRRVVTIQPTASDSAIWCAHGVAGPACHRRAFLQCGVAVASSDRRIGSFCSVILATAYCRVVAAGLALVATGYRRVEGAAKVAMAAADSRP